MGAKSERAELGRLVLLDDVPANGESYFLARAFELLRRERGYVSLVSFSDDTARTDAGGRVVFKGHVGLGYQASNALYTGRGTPSTLYLLPDGTVLAPRSLQKIRTRESRWRVAHDALVAVGAEPMTASEDSRAWLARALARCCRTVRNRGNHRYVIGLDRAARKALPRAVQAAGMSLKAYPKFTLMPEAA